MQQALQCQKKSQEGWGNQHGFKELGLELRVEQSMDFHIQKSGKRALQVKGIAKVKV